MSFLSALTDAILPVLAVAVVGVVLGRVRDVDVDSLSSVTIYVLVPALTFHSLATTPLSKEEGVTLTLAIVGFTLGMLVLAEVVGRLAGASGSGLSGVVLTSAFPNVGNFGIPLSAFAFGAIGRSTAIVYTVVQGVLMYTIGVYVASRGETGSTWKAAKSVFRLPLIYALLAALLARAMGVVPPSGGPVMQTIELTGNASIPVMLLLLGIQLAETRFGSALTRASLTTGLKLFAAPALAAGVALVVGLTGTVGRVFVLESAMPAAVTPLMLTIEFGGGDPTGDGPTTVSTAILLSTLGSILTLAVLIALLRSGALGL